MALGNIYRPFLQTEEKGYLLYHCCTKRKKPFGISPERLEFFVAGARLELTTFGL
jgi:hypothetical protein